MLEVALHNPRQHNQFQHNGEPLLLARSAGEAPLWTPVDPAASQEIQPTVQIVAGELGVRLTNTGCELVCDDAEYTEAGDCCALSVPTQFTIGDTLFEIVDTGRFSPPRPLQKLQFDETALAVLEASAQGPSPATIARWFSGLGSLNRWARSLQALYVQEAQCAVDAIGLDGAMVLRRRDERWEIAASHLPHPEFGIHCDVAVLDELLQSPQTLFHGDAGADPALPAVVVSPLRNAAGNIVGAIYGSRSVHPGNFRRSIRYLEANLIELLAGAVSEAIARVERESEVDRRRALLEQAFALSQAQTPPRIVSEQREVTLLFADLRDFTELIAPLETEQVYELLGHVMDCLTAAVMDHDGLVIDYFGDGLAAMWNAPADQCQHPELACRAALRMMQKLPEIAADWHDLLFDELRIGVGVHTGWVQVGNAGSQRRAKYGPRGPEVHLASRVECATKEIGVPLVVTRPTAERLSNRLTPHRLCRARMRGLPQPIDLFTLSGAAANEAERAAWRAYDAALSLFEDGQLNDAAHVLQSIDDSSADVPLQFLAQQVARELGRAQRRRRTDAAGSTPQGVVTLNAK
jgi:adenylate cyclase